MNYLRKSVFPVLSYAYKSAAANAAAPMNDPMTRVLASEVPDPELPVPEVAARDPLAEAPEPVVVPFPALPAPTTVPFGPCPAVTFCA